MTARLHPSRYWRMGAAMFLVAPALGGCAAKLPKLPVCDGKHRRDANPYGTVLPGAPPKAPAAAEPPPGPVPTEPPSAPKTSAIAPSTTFVSC